MTTEIYNETTGTTWTIEKIREELEKVRNILIKEGFNVNPCDSVEINTRLVNSFGRTTKFNDKNKGIHTFKVEMNANYLKVGQTENIIKTIAHEAIHLCEGCFDHKAGFKYAASRLQFYGYKDIKRTRNDQEYKSVLCERKKSHVKYKAKCKVCGKIYGPYFSMNKTVKTLLDPTQSRYYCTNCHCQKFTIIQEKGGVENIMMKEKN